MKCWADLLHVDELDHCFTKLSMRDVRAAGAVCLSWSEAFRRILAINSTGESLVELLKRKAPSSWVRARLLAAPFEAENVEDEDNKDDEDDEDDPYSDNALNLAITEYESPLDVVKVLMEHETGLFNSLPMREEGYPSLLLLASSAARPDLVSEFLAAGADANEYSVPFGSEEIEIRALSICCELGRPQRDWTFHGTMEDIFHPVYLPSVTAVNHAKCAKLLLEAGATLAEDVDQLCSRHFVEELFEAAEMPSPFAPPVE
jgi:hypothetical protein